MSYVKGGTAKPFTSPCTGSSVNKRENSASASQEREFNNSPALWALLFKPACTGSDRDISEHQLKTLKERYFSRKCQLNKIYCYMRRESYF